MQALVVPDAKDNILSLSKIADQGYRFSGNKYSIMEFCNPCTGGRVFAAYRNAKQFYVIDLATSNHNVNVILCNAFPLDFRLHSSHAGRSNVPAKTDYLEILKEEMLAGDGVPRTAKPADEDR